MTQSRIFSREDTCILIGFALFAALVHVGRIGASINGVHLDSDVSMYCAIAAAWGNPVFFAQDFSFGDPANFITHVTPLVRLVHWLAVHWTDGNYGLAYLTLTGPVLFLHYSAFYLMGRIFFNSPWKALLFSVLVSMAYWTPWGTYWGAGILDYTPRVIFNGLYALLACLCLRCLKSPGWWPVIMLLTSGTVYVHQVSALPCAAGLWLSFLISKPQHWSWTRHLGWLVVSGLCFVAGITPYALIFLHSSGYTLSPSEVEYLRHIVMARFDWEYSLYWQGMLKFYRQYTLLPVLPLSLWGTWILLRHGTDHERSLLKHIWLWIAGVYIVVALFLADQIVSQSLGRVPLEFDLVRVHRLLPFFGMCLIFLGVNVLWRLCLQDCSLWNRTRLWAARVFCAGVCLGFFLGGLHDMARAGIGWYWNSLDDSRYERAYARDLARDAMIEAIRTRTAPNSTIFVPWEEQAVRYRAFRPLSWGWKDACYLYYVKNLDALHEWERVSTLLKETPASYIQAGLSTRADYIVSNRPQDKALLVAQVGPVVWENTHYLLVRNGHRQVHGSQNGR